MNDSLISVIIPCYNGEKYLEKCLDSLLNQTYNNIEVIVVDDGSTDDTSNIIKRYIDIFASKHITFKNIYQENSGQAAAVNNGLKYVEGQFLVWQDCDDYYEYDALESMVEYLQNNPNIDFVRGKITCREEKSINKIICEKGSKYPNITNIFDFYIFETDSYSYAGIFMVRMEFFDKCIKNREIYQSRAGQNWQLILPLAYNGQCGYLDKIVYNITIIPTSHSHSAKTMKTLLKRCDAHKDILIHVLNEIEMPEKELTKYKKYINKKYIKKKIGIILSRIKKVFGGKNDKY